MSTTSITHTHDYASSIVTTASIVPTQEHVNEFDNLPLYLQPVYRRLFGLSQQEGYAFCANDWLTKKFKRALKTIERWFSILRRLGFVYTEYDHKSKTRRIFCTICPYAPSKKRPRTYTITTLTNAPEQPLSVGAENAVPLPIEEIEKKDSNANSATTPPPLPDPSPCPSVVVVPSDSVSDSPEVQVMQAQQKGAGDAGDAGATHPQEQLTGITGESPESASLPSPPIPTTNHPQTGAQTAEIVKELEQQGIRPHAVAVQLATDHPDACRQHLATFRPELHKTPGGYLRWAITNGIAPDKPKPATERSTVLQLDRQAYLQAGVVKIIGQEVPPRHAANGTTLPVQHGSVAAGTSVGIGNMRGVLASKFRRYSGAVGD